jgi:hypothetical protein
MAFEQQQHQQHQHQCGQESRLIKLEAAIENISGSMTDIKNLLSASIRAEERILSLRTESLDQERRIRKLELAQAGSRWVERIVWLAVVAAINFYLSVHAGGGFKL